MDQNERGSLSTPIITTADEEEEPRDSSGSAQQHHHHHQPQQRENKSASQEVADRASSSSSPSSGGKQPVASSPNDTHPPIPSDGKETGRIEEEQDASPFGLSVLELQRLVDPKSPGLLEEYGGPTGVLDALKTHPTLGLVAAPAGVPTPTTTATTETADKPKPPAVGTESDERNVTFMPEKRQDFFGRNELPPVKSRNIFELIWLAFQDKILIMLSVTAIGSLIVGIVQDFVPGADGKSGSGSTTDNDADDSDQDVEAPHWVEGLAILIAVIVVVLVSSINDFQKARQFQRLNAKKEDRQVQVIRNGEKTFINVHDLVVGDLMVVEPGEILAADAVFVSGHNCKCDESAATGESDAIKKGLDKDPFFLSGSKVLEGVATCVVIAVGPHSYNGKTMLGLRTEYSATPLQEKLNNLAEKIAKLGGAVGISLFVILLIKYFATTGSSVGFGDGPDQHGATLISSNVLSVLITTFAIITVAVPEGLPLAVTLALAFATTQMLKENNLVRVLASCETMGHATTICSDKTGTLTQNVMTVVAGTLGHTVKFNDQSRVKRLPTELPAPYLDLLNEAIAVNSTAFKSHDDKGNPTLLGSKTETALLGFQKEMGFDFVPIREKTTVTQLYPFSSERKSMSTLIKVPTTASEPPVYRLHVKGASEIVLSYCSSVCKLSPDSPAGMETVKRSSQVSEDLAGSITNYAEQSLRTICLAYRDFSEEDLNAFPNLGDRPPTEGLTCLGIVGIEDPVREGVPSAVKRCQEAGVFVRMVTGDNLITAKAIATKCGIYQRDVGVVMEGHHFRNLAPDEMYKTIPKLQVLARSSPTDKQLLVAKLQEMGEVVAVTGDGTNDGPALKMADVGFSMGLTGTEVAKEASAIVLMDDNFTSIVKALMWGRSVNDAVKKFLQFQLTVNIGAVIVAFVTSIASPEQASILTTVQLLWINLIMDSLGALALATERPSDEILKRLPESKKAPLITFNMWKMIIGQAVVQIIVNLVLFFLPGPILGVTVTDEQAATYGRRAESRVVQSMIFNAFYFLTLFNEVNCRRLDNNINIFENATKNPWFLSVLTLTTLAQVLIIQFGGIVFNVVPLSIPQWVVSVGIGLLSLPIGVVIRLIPDEVLGRRSEPVDEEFQGMHRDRVAWMEKMNKMQTQLRVFRALRGAGRLEDQTTASVTAGAYFVGVAAALGAPMDAVVGSHVSEPRRKGAAPAYATFQRMAKQVAAKQQQQQANGTSHSGPGSVYSPPTVAEGPPMEATDPRVLRTSG